ncbi:hypothetical protein [Embleya hyalina]|uniref:Uncharacterized protein n=1 Tax=Embleya hyalina TaxID=516124 RepID=A0A401YTC6_9ACTN|nr:hypothetical protein [Embleya hyalina]GCD97805.1 hypothetical protein EHYA_05501 [Embleya hyalina]
MALPRARDVVGLAPTTLHQPVKPVVELGDCHDLPPWQSTRRHLDKYFAGGSGSGPARRSAASC